MQFTLFLNNINKLQCIYELEIEIMAQCSKLVICLAKLRLFFNEIAHLHNLQKLTVRTGAKEWISPDTSQDVLKKIAGMNGLKSLELHFVGAAGVQRLSQYLPHTLQELNLCEHDITDSDIDIIAQGLKGLRDLRSLNLCRNSIQGGNLASLVEALTLQQNFSSLDLSYNPMNDSGCIKALGNLRNLRQLNLKGSGVDIEELVNVLLLNNITLQSLTTTGNDRHIGIKSLLPLAQLTDLHHLDISEGLEFKANMTITLDNRAPLESNLLAAMLKNLTKLESIRLCDQSTVKPHWNTDLTRVISYHPRLRLVNAVCLNFNW